MQLMGWAVVAAGGCVALVALLLRKHMGLKLLLGKRAGLVMAMLGMEFADLVMLMLMPRCVDLVALLLPGCVVSLLLPGCVGLMALLLPGCAGLMSLLLPGCVDLVALQLQGCLDLHHRCLNFEFGDLEWVAEWISWWWLMMAE